MRDSITITDIISESISAIKSRGYEPEFCDDTNTEIMFMVEGVPMRVYELSEGIFGYCAEFKLNGKLADEVKTELCDVLDGEEVAVFEYIHFEEDAIVLSSGFPNECFDTGCIDDAITTVCAKGGIAEAIKSKTGV